MAPELFSLVPGVEDERSFLAQGGAEARKQVTSFRDSFITQQAPVERWPFELFGGLLG